MKSWEMLKKTIPMFFCLSKNSTQIEKEGVYLFKSGVNHYSCNVAIIGSWADMSYSSSLHASRNSITQFILDQTRTKYKK